MKDLSPFELELAAIGSAIGSNCVPCVEYHIREAKKLGLTDSQLFQVIQMCEKVKKVPANKVSEAALKLMDDKLNKLL